MAKLRRRRVCCNVRDRRPATEALGYSRMRSDQPRSFGRDDRSTTTPHFPDPDDDPALLAAVRWTLGRLDVLRHLVPWCARVAILFVIWMTFGVAGKFVVIVFAGPLVSLGLIDVGFLVTRAERIPERTGSRAVGRLVASTMPLAELLAGVPWLVVLALSTALRVATKGVFRFLVPALLSLGATGLCVMNREGVLVTLVWGVVAGILVLHSVAQKLDP